MTLGQFRKLTENMPDNLDLFVAERRTEFSFGLVNSAYVKEIGFAEDPMGETIAELNMEVLVLDEY